nr:hypothetical protein [Sphingobium yanoikuyae]
MQFIYAVIGAGEEGDPGELEALVDMRRVLDIAGDAIERFGDDDVEFAPIGGGQHGIEVRAVLVLAGDGSVWIGRYDLPPLSFSVGSAQPDLILGRQGVLHVGAEARVYGGAAPFR